MISMEKTTKKSKPVRTRAARENQLINLAVELAEKKLRDGTASSQIITTLLNLASAKYKLELKKLESDVSLSEAKIENLKQSENAMTMYEDALKAFKSYKGDQSDEEDEDENIF